MKEKSKGSILMVGEQGMSDDQWSLWKHKGHVYTELHPIDSDSELSQVSHGDATANYKASPTPITPPTITKSHHLWENGLDRAESLFSLSYLNKRCRLLISSHDSSQE